MSNANTLAQYKKQTKAAFVSRAKYAIKARSLKLCVKVANDFLKDKFARFLVVDSNGTIKFNWTLKGAYSWLAYGAKDFVQIVDTRDFSIVAERRQAYA